METASRTPEDNQSEIKPINPLGTPLNIISVAEKTEGETTRWEVQVNEENLKEFTTNLEKCGCSKISIVSVLGAYRTGKSFLLDLMLRHLQYGKENWFKGNVETKFKEDEVSNYFTFRKQKERVTTGIWFYSQPYIRNGVAIVLMDTQGLHDLQSPVEINKAVFSLSTLLSSFQILNIQNRVSEDDLQTLEFFAEFARSAVELNNRSAKTKIDLKAFQFQRLEFLVRDWTHFDEETDYEICRKSMSDFLDNTFERKKHDEGTRDRIMSMFEEITCMGLPFPGRCVNKKDWDGKLEDIDDEFRILVDSYFNDIFENHIVEKDPLFPGQQMSAGLLQRYVTTFTEIFRSGELPEAVNLAKAFAYSIHLNAKDKALDSYEHAMDEILANNTYVDEDEFMQAHNKAERDSKGLFEQKSQYGKVEDRDAVAEDFRRQILDRFEKYREVNKARMAKLLNKYALVVSVAILAWLLDRTSDYVCDWWSKECVKLSNVAWLLYMMIFGVVGVMAFFVYKEKGQIVLGKSLMGLGGEVWENFSKWYANVKAQLSGDDGIASSKKDD